MENRSRADIADESGCVVTYPDDAEFHKTMNVRRPRLRIHSSMLMAKHDLACAVCQEYKAVYRMDLGVFGPCSLCAGSWELRQTKPGWVPSWLKRMLGGRSQ